MSEQIKHHQDKNTDCNVNLSIPLDIAYGFNINPKIKVGEVKSYPGRRRICCRKGGKYVMYQLVCIKIPFDINIEIEDPNHFPHNIE